MRSKKLIYFLIFLLFSLTHEGFTQKKLEAKAPLITHSFAVEKGPYGYIWKIYIEAEDTDGDMVKIASIVDEPGVGRYPTDWIILKPEFRKNLRGYIQWNTHALGGSLPEWTPITLKVSIIDKAGNESNEVTFPFSFELGVKDPYEYKLPPPFDKGEIPRLGYIHIDLIPPGGLNGDGDLIIR